MLQTRLKGGAVQPYGIGVNAKQRDLVGFVNGVLETMRTEAAGQASYNAGCARR